MNFIVNNQSGRRTAVESNRVIVSADDFGLSEEVNDGIIAAYQKGSIDSVSLMPSGAAFEHAVKLLKKHPALDVGLHLTLVEEMPVLPPKKIPSLVCRGGFFYANWRSFLTAYALGYIDKKEIDGEIKAQFDKVFRRGILVSHIDSHQHLHMLPGILEIVMKYAKQYHIFKIRRPYTPWQIGKMLFRWNPKKLLGCFLLNHLCWIQYKRLNKSGFLGGAKHYWNVSIMGSHFKQAVEEFVAASCGRSWELSFHPAIFSDNLSRKYSHWRYHWHQEYQYLVHEEFQRCLSNANIQRHNFRNFN